MCDNFEDTSLALSKNHVNLLLQSIPFRIESSSVLVMNISIISTDKDPSLRIERLAIINLRGVSMKLN